MPAGWEERWRDFHRPVRVGRLWVGPPWETPPDGVGGDRGRPRPRVRHRRPRDDAPLPASCSPSSSAGACSTSAAARACSRSPRRGSGFAPVLARRPRPAGGRGDPAERRRERRRRSTCRLADALDRAAAAGGRRRSRTSRPRAVALVAAAARRRARSSRPATSSATRPTPDGLPPRAARDRGRLGGRPVSARGVESRAVATFSVRFLGCKVSHVDAQEIRERLLADGHSERDDGAEVAVVNTCCVTHEARAQVAARRFAGRPHAPARLRHRLRREPRRRRLRRPAGERRRRRAAERGDAGGRRARRRRDRLRPRRRAARPRPRVREGAGRLQLLVQLLRDPAGARRLAQPARRGGAARGPAARRARATARSSSPGSTSAATATATAGYELPRLVREAGADAGARTPAALVDRDQPRGPTSSPPPCARRRRSRATCTCRSSPATTACCARWARRYDAATYLRRLEPLGDFNLTTDVIVGFPAEDERRLRAARWRVVEAAGVTKRPRLPVLAAARDGDRRGRHGPARGEAGAERAAAGGLARREPRAAGARSSAARTSSSSTGPGRGYGDDYSPWLVDAPVGELVRVRGAAVTEEGIRAA